MAKDHSHHGWGKNPRWNENCYAMTFGGDYGFKDGTESMILSARAESIILSASNTESIIPSAHHAESKILAVPFGHVVTLTAAVKCSLRQHRHDHWDKRLFLAIMAMSGEKVREVSG